jgi:hypothetical protein
MFDAERPWRRLATHPVELVRTLHGECKRGLITEDERDALCARVKANADAFNAAAKVVNAAVRENEGVLPADQTGPKVHALCDSLAVASADQRRVIDDATATALDWRGVRGAVSFVRWDQEDRSNMERYGGGHCDDDEDQETWDNGESVGSRSLGDGDGGDDDDFYE